MFLIGGCFFQLYFFSALLLFLFSSTDFGSGFFAIGTELLDGFFELGHLCQTCFGKFLLRESFFSASAIPDSASYFQTVFDQPKPDRRVVAMLDQVLGEVENEICRMWPSKHESLRERGVLT